MGKERIPVGVLGATGVVGQELVRRLQSHPLFELVAVAASERSAGRRYGEVVQWRAPGEIPEATARLEVKPAVPDLPCRLVFSALDATTARGAEEVFARTGYAVISNASAWRMDPQVPLVVPEVNPDHIRLARDQRFAPGAIVTNPNCCVAGLALVLKPLLDAFGVEEVMVTTLQAVSGAGYPGLSALDVLGNVIPLIPGEEEKLQAEPAKILGSLVGGQMEPAPLRISAQAMRVPVLDGHTLSVSVRLGRRAPVEDVRDVLGQWRGAPQARGLPSAPQRPLVVSDDPNAPQPRRHLHAGNGMTVTVGRLRACTVFDARLVALVHNGVRGAAGAALLNAELLVREGSIAARHPAGGRLWVA